MATTRHAIEQKISVTCDLQVSSKCRKAWQVTRRTFNQTTARNNGKIICLYCSRTSKFTGRTNPNCRYKGLDDRLFDDIDSEAKAYLLGWIASDGSITRGRVVIAIHTNDTHTLSRLRDIVSKEIPIKRKKNRSIAYFEINSSRIQEKVCQALNIEPGKKDRTVGFPRLKSDELTWAFIRGYFDGDGSISTPGTGRIACSIASQSNKLRNGVKEFCQVKCSDYGDKLEWHSNNALDFLHKIYQGANYYLPRKRELYFDIATWVPSLRGRNFGRLEKFRWVKTDPRAQAPFKERASDSGYDLTLIEKVGQRGHVELYTTGIKIQPDYGWYFDLIPRSSIIKTGYMVANSIGVIDRTFVGPIIVPLVKIDPSGEDLVLPARIVQIVPRPIIHVEWVLAEELDSTERGDGGFGSTGK
jgi:deoxyuridine 5'-triphosphate nucleotidohydrolase